MCLGTFSRLARSLATSYIFARVRIIGTLAPFCVIGNSKEFSITQKGTNVPMMCTRAKMQVVASDALGTRMCQGSNCSQVGIF